MRKLFLSLILWVVFVFPSLASAQSNVTISSMTVQLWPEYDQPSMLVIVDFLPAADTALPVDLTFRIPPDANLIAVASHAGSGNFMNSAFSGVGRDGEWQVFTMTLTVNTMYRFEYYQPLTLNGNQRIFSYLWDGAYAVDEFHVLVLEPRDVVSLSMTPAHASVAVESGGKYYDSGLVKLAGGEQFALNLQYEKTTDMLSAPPQGLQPAAPVDENTLGRVSLNNSLPYLIGGLGVVMIVGGIVYYWQAGRAPSKRTRRRTHVEAKNEDAGGDSYCPQCGMRAKPGDHFCRICGARLRNQEE
ncbi:MAG: zinc ribbon domain-containing protein [Anaerolineales bacterium]|nr:MAG: zinc ribbon domain-containing protein [Anaerolineales bacterium]